jgi:poly(hydroxyalkanoate) depolymerase family esterase
MRNTCWISLAMLLVACVSRSEDASAPDEPEGVVQQELSQVTGFGSNPGNLLMFTHVPSGLPANAPVVLVLHGCTQTAAAMEASGWTAAANAHGFYLVYAQQQSANNSASCFNWFEPGDIARGQGEALSLRQMVGWVLANASTDPDRIYVMGFSAGAYMAAVLAATYPDVFAGVAISAGGPYRCATTSSEAFMCMNPGVNRTPAAWGDLVRNAFPGYAGRRPKITLWHGATDTTVRPSNLTESMEQWTDVLGADQTPDLTETVAGHTHKVYRDGTGAAVVETYEIAGMGHAVPVDPQFALPGGAACGSTGAYFSDVNLCAVYRQELFFGLVEGDDPPPTGTTVSFSGIAAEDGYVKALADGSSPAVGTISTLAVGRGTDGKYNRAILSFDTSSLPDGAVITAATVTVTYSSSSGSPWSNPAGNTMVVDVRRGTFGAAGTETSDWAAAADAAAAATIAAFSSGTRTSSGFSAAGLGAINTAGRTQLRLRFSADQTSTAYVFLGQGTSTTLTVTYQ